MCPWHFINLLFVLVERPWVWIRFGILLTTLFIRGPGNVLGIATVRAGRSGDRIQLGTRFSAPVQTGPGAEPASGKIFPGGKTSGAWRWQPTPSSAEVEERVKLYLCSPSGPSWPVLGWTLPFTFLFCVFVSKLMFLLCWISSSFPLTVWILLNPSPWLRPDSKHFGFSVIIKEYCYWNIFILFTFIL